MTPLKDQGDLSQYKPFNMTHQLLYLDYYSLNKPLPLIQFIKKSHQSFHRMCYSAYIFLCKLQTDSKELVVSKKDTYNKDSLRSLFHPRLKACWYIPTARAVWADALRTLAPQHGSWSLMCKKRVGWNLQQLPLREWELKNSFKTCAVTAALRHLRWA